MELADVVTELAQATAASLETLQQRLSTLEDGQNRLPGLLREGSELMQETRKLAEKAIDGTATLNKLFERYMRATDKQISLLKERIYALEASNNRRLNRIQAEVDRLRDRVDKLHPPHRDFTMPPGS